MKLKVGDKVKYVGKLENLILENKIGKVVFVDGQGSMDMVGVQFDDFVKGHKLNGLIKENNGYYVWKKELKLLNSKKGNIDEWS